MRICIFSVGSEHVSIYFSGQVQTSDPRYPCVNNLPIGTVLRIDVLPKKSVAFNRKEFKGSDFKSFDPSQRRTKHYKAYLDRRNGFLINTQNGKIVEAIYFAASQDTHLCTTYYSNPKEYIVVELRGMPPLISLNCLSVAGEKPITIKALVPTNDIELWFVWTLSNGRLIKGQHTDTAIIDPDGLEGQKLEVSAEVAHKSGLAAMARCIIEIRKM